MKKTQRIFPSPYVFQKISPNTKYQALSLQIKYSIIELINHPPIHIYRLTQHGGPSLRIRLNPLQRPSYTHHYLHNHTSNSKYTNSTHINLNHIKLRPHGSPTQNRTLHLPLHLRRHSHRNIRLHALDNDLRID